MTTSSKDKAPSRLDMMALTISPPPNNDIIKCYKRWKYRLSKLKSDFVLYPEIAYNEKENILRLHFHGRIDCKDMGLLQKDIEYLKTICFIDVKPIYDDYKWYLYCIKELPKTRSSLRLAKKEVIYYTKINVKINSVSKNLDDYFNDIPPPVYP